MSTSRSRDKAANLRASERLQRVDQLLADGDEHSTLDIIARCAVCAVSAIVSELRANGRAIVCRRDRDRRYYGRVA